MQKEAPYSVRSKRPVKPAGKENRRHGEGHVQVRIRAAQQRLAYMSQFTLRIGNSPANRPDPGQQTKPVREENKDEDRGEKPKCPAREITSNVALQEVPEAFPQPLPEVLRPARDFLDVSRRISGEK